MLCALTCNAEDHDNSYLKLAGGLNDNNLLHTKSAMVGHQGPLLGVFDYQLELGLLQHPQGISVFGGPSIGLSIVQTGYYAKVFTGPSILSPTDDRLGTTLEISSDLEIGVRDERGVSMGIGYKHISNAGTGGVNLGRDFIYFKVGF